jgi:histidine triad (HIT) family protein
MTDNCLFCKIAAGEIPSAEVYSDDEFFAFRDIHPIAPTHILVIPKRHVDRVADAVSADEGMLGRLILTANKIAAQEGLVENGYRFVINSGPWAGQTVFHLHLHILGGRRLEDKLG